MIEDVQATVKHQAKRTVTVAEWVSAAFVSIASSSAFIVIPFVTGLLTKNFSVSSVFIFDLGVAFVSILLAINLFYRYKKVFNLHAKSTIMRKAFR